MTILPNKMFLSRSAALCLLPLPVNITPIRHCIRAPVLVRRFRCTQGTFIHRIPTILPDLYNRIDAKYPF